MKITSLFGKRFKEKPADIKIKSHELMVRGGYIRQVYNGIYTYLPPAKKAMLKIENIIREEMNKIGGQEIEMPLLHPRELWEESGRYDTIEGELFRLKDRTGHDFVLAMTHEETVTAVARSDSNSYKDFPFILYQIAKKERDELRPRAGLLRVKEFTMKDAYSFHTNKESLQTYYQKFAIAYKRIFERVGLRGVLPIKADTGMMGGSVSHEYMAMTEAGEDNIFICEKCGYHANKEVASANINVLYENEPEQEIEKISTPGTITIDALAEFLKIPTSKTVKGVFYQLCDEKKTPVIVMIRGDLDVNELKMEKALKSPYQMMEDENFAKIGVVAGYGSGFGIKGCKIFADKSILNEKNLVAGANEKGYHLLNFNLARDVKDFEVVDIAEARAGDGCVKCSAPLVVKKGVEVGHIFQLGDKYTKTMAMTYLDENNSPQTPIMGCYGIGIGRLFATICETYNDDNGPKWPISIAPWQIEVILINPKQDEKVSTEAEKIYQELLAEGWDVLFDDRAIGAGEKFADADLLGAPLRLIVSPKNLEKNQVEWKSRISDEAGAFSLDNTCHDASEWVRLQYKQLRSNADSVMPLPEDEVK